MHKSLIQKNLVDLRSQILGWGCGMGFMLVLLVALYPSISATYGDMISQLPDGFRAFMGVEFSVDTLEGYLNAEFITYAPIALSVLPIISGTSSIIGEENQGVLDLLLAQPISRFRLVVIKMMSLALANGIVVSILLSMFWLTIPFISVEMGAGRIVWALILLWPFLTAVSFLSVLLSLVLSNRLAAGTLIAVLLLGSFILESISNLVSSLAVLKPIYLTSYYQGSNALSAEVSWAYTAGLIGIILGSLYLSIWLFIRRDISVHSAIGVRRLLQVVGVRSMTNAESWRDS